MTTNQAEYRRKLNEAVIRVLDDMIQKEQEGIDKLIHDQEKQLEPAARALVMRHILSNSKHRLGGRYHIPGREELDETINGAYLEYSEYPDLVAKAEEAIKQLREIQEYFTGKREAA